MKIYPDKDKVFPIADSTIYLSYSEAFDNIIGGEHHNALMSHRFVIIDVPTDSIEWHEAKDKSTI